MMNSSGSSSGITNKKMKKKSNLLLRGVSVILDMAAVYSLASILQAAIYQVTFYPFVVIFVMTLMSYYFLSSLLFEGRTPAKVFTNLKVVAIDGEKPGIKRLLVREVILKGILGITLPFYLFSNLPLQTHVIKTATEMALILIVYLIYFLIYKTAWWEYYSGTLTIKEKARSNKSLAGAFAILASSYLLYAIVSVYPLVKDRDSFTQRFPLSYPSTPEVRRYAEFIKASRKDPVEYILDLFNKYDLVVISERMHPEYSQYELISRLVRDPRFIRLAGNIFTECGSVSYQDSLNRYLVTEFENEKTLDIATAALQRNSTAVWPLWDCTNLFDLFKSVNQINATLPDSLKIRWYFTDGRINWAKATQDTFEARYRNRDRDSLMASVVIDTYTKILSRQSRNKALVIMNTYHGYGLPPNGRNYYQATTAFIMKALPGKVANIMLNTVGMEYLWAFVPVQHGKWDAAFRLSGNLPAGFDFEGSPFGEDHFDARYGQIKGLKYKDVFTGFIYYTSLEDQYCKNGFPYTFYKCEGAMLKRSACVDQDYAGMIQRMIDEQKTGPGNSVHRSPAKYPIIYNSIHMILLPAIMILILLTLTISFFIKRRKISKGRLGV